MRKKVFAILSPELTSIKDSFMEKENNIIIRPATIDDARRLFEWRNDPETRNQSINTKEVVWDSHLEWLKNSLVNPNRRIMIALEGDEPVGTVRLDIEGLRREISWTVAPFARGRGLGALMVKRALETFDKPIIARIKPENIASVKLALQVGFRKTDENPEMTEWVYDL